MTLLARLRSSVAALVSGRRLERQMDEEWRFHVETRVDTLAAEGVPRDEALRRARVEFGDPLRWKEGGREARGVIWIYDLGADLRYGVRQLRRAPVFAATAIVTLALGIGANTLAFSILNAVLIRELPYRDPDRIVLVNFSPADEPDNRGGATLQNYFAVRDRSQAFEFVGSMSTVTASIAVEPGDAAGAEPVVGQRIHATLPRVLGVAPALGAWFTEADDPPTAPRKLVLSHGLWQQRFAGDRGVIGRLVRMDAQEATIVGVMPEGFELLNPAAQYWTPSRWSDATMMSPSRMLVVAARLKPGVTRQQAQAEMDVLAASLAREFPNTNKGWSIHLESIYETYTWRARGPLLLLQGVVALVLLIACANVAGLLLSQASARQQEFAMRIALGSSRGRLVRQLFAESLLLSCIGGACGIGLALAGLRVFMAQNPMIWLPRAGGIALDGQVLVFAALATAASSILFGLLPSWTISRTALIPAIKHASAVGRMSPQQMRGVLVSGQMAVALVLLIAAGLLLNTMVRLNLNRPGIDPANLLAFQVRLTLSEMVTPTGRDAEGFFTMKFSPRASQIFSQIQERLSVVPGVRSVAASVAAPATPAPFRFRVTAAGRPQPADAGMEPAGWFPISSDYFRTLGIAVRRGREFTKSDSLASPQVAVVNETLARRLWPGEDPIGREITIDFINDRPRQVVGVVTDVRETSNQREFAPHVFVPEAQLPLASRGWFQSPRITMTYLVRTATDPLPLVDRLRSAVAEVYRSQPIYSIKTMDEAMSEQLASWRQYLMLLGAFAGIAASLTLVGVYGLVAYGVGQRMREIGIRRALGASAGAVLRLVLRQGLILTGVGVGVGVMASLAATRILEGLLWGVSPTDPVTFALVAMGLAAAALLACYVPARRALAINPIVALRAE
jgi:putative ABC transport system permease protein